MLRVGRACSWGVFTMDSTAEVTAPRACLIRWSYSYTSVGRVMMLHLKHNSICICSIALLLQPVCTVQTRFLRTGSSEISSIAPFNTVMSIGMMRDNVIVGWFCLLASKPAPSPLNHASFFFFLLSLFAPKQIRFAVIIKNKPSTAITSCCTGQSKAEQVVCNVAQ